MDSVVVSVRIKRETKTNLEHAGINLEESIREFIAQKEAFIKLKKTVERLSRAIREKEIKPSKSGFAANSVRGDRDAAH